MYTFKRIDSNVKNENIYKNGLASEHQLVAGATVSDALKSLKNRNRENFVSLSSDVIATANETALTHGWYESKRDKVVVIKGFEGTELKPKSFYANGHSVSDIKKVPLFAMDRLVLDCSTEKSIKDLAIQELVNTRAYGFVTKEDGVLVYGGVKGNNIATILNPLDIDMLYALLKDYGINEQNVTAFINMVMPFVVRDVNEYDFTASERALFEAMYVENKNLTTVLYEIMEANNIKAEMIRKEDESFVTMPDLTKDLVIMNYDEEFDALNILSYLKNQKRNILNKVFNKCGFKVSNVSIVEDELKVARMGKVFHDENARLKYKGVNIIIPPQTYMNTFSKFDGYRSVETALLCGDMDMLKENKDALEAGYDAEKFIKGLVKTPRN